MNTDDAKTSPILLPDSKLERVSKKLIFDDFEENTVKNTCSSDLKTSSLVNFCDIQRSQQLLGKNKYSNSFMQRVKRKLDFDTNDDCLPKKRFCSILSAENVFVSPNARHYLTKSLISEGHSFTNSSKSVKRRLFDDVGNNKHSTFCPKNQIVNKNLINLSLKKKIHGSSTNTSRRTNLMVNLAISKYNISSDDNKSESLLIDSKVFHSRKNFVNFDKSNHSPIFNYNERVQRKLNFDDTSHTTSLDSNFKSLVLDGQLSRRSIKNDHSMLIGKHSSKKKELNAEFTDSLFKFEQSEKLQANYDNSLNEKNPNSVYFKIKEKKCQHLENQSPILNTNFKIDINSNTEENTDISSTNVEENFEQDFSDDKYKNSSLSSSRIISEMNKYSNVTNVSNDILPFNKISDKMINEYNKNMSKRKMFQNESSHIKKLIKNSKLRSLMKTEIQNLTDAGNTGSTNCKLTRNLLTDVNASQHNTNSPVMKSAINKGCVSPIIGSVDIDKQNLKSICVSESSYNKNIITGSQCLISSNDEKIRIQSPIVSFFKNKRIKEHDHESLLSLNGEEIGLSSPVLTMKNKIKCIKSIEDSMKSEVSTSPLFHSSQVFNCIGEAIKKLPNYNETFNTKCGLNKRNDNRTISPNLDASKRYRRIRLSNEYNKLPKYIQSDGGQSTKINSHCKSFFDKRSSLKESLMRILPKRYADNYKGESLLRTRNIKILDYDMNDEGKYLEQHLQRFLNDCIEEQKNRNLDNLVITDSFVDLEENKIIDNNMSTMNNMDFKKECTPDSEISNKSSDFELCNHSQELKIKYPSDRVHVNDSAVSVNTCRLNNNNPVLKSDILCYTNVLKKKSINLEEQNSTLSNSVQLTQQQIVNEFDAANCIIDDSSDTESIEIVKNKPTNNGEDTVISTVDANERKISTLESCDSTPLKNNIGHPFNAQETFDSAKKQRRKKSLSNSLISRLKTLVNREKSEFTMWQYELTRMDISNSDVDLCDIPAVFYVQSYWKENTKSILYCTPIWHHSTDLDCNHFIKSALSERLSDHVLMVLNQNENYSIAASNVIRIYPPWRTLYSKALNMMIMLSICKLQVMPNVNDNLISAVVENFNLHGDQKGDDEKMTVKETQTRSSLMEFLLDHRRYEDDTKNSNNLNIYMAETISNLKGTINEAVYLKMLCPVNSLQLSLHICTTQKIRSETASNVWVVVGYDTTETLCCVFIRDREEWYENLQASKGRYYTFNGVIAKRRVFSRNKSSVTDWLNLLGCDSAEFQNDSQKSMCAFLVSEKCGFMVRSIRN